mgnify:CR=1 FL=1
MNTTSGSLPFKAIVTGIPGATLSAGAGTTSSAVLLNAERSGAPDRRLQRHRRGCCRPVQPMCSDAVPVTVTRDGAAAVHLHAQSAVGDDSRHGRSRKLQRVRGPGLQLDHRRPTAVHRDDHVGVEW